MKMPWQDKKSVQKMLDDEEKDLLEIIRYHHPGDREYEEALSKLERLFEMDIEKKKISAFNGRGWKTFAEGIATIVLVLTHERWEPLPGAASRFIKNKFGGNQNDNHLLM